MRSAPGRPPPCFRKFAIDATLVPGTGGIFEVKVGEHTVAKRIKGHFPDAAEIVAAVAARQK